MLVKMIMSVRDVLRITCSLESSVGREVSEFYGITMMKGIVVLRISIAPEYNAMQSIENRQLIDILMSS